MKKTYIILLSVIVSVGLSYQDPAYTAAIKNDQLKWQRVSDLRGSDNESGKLYGVRSIPDIFLSIP